jgi:hypothetical protein
MYMSRAFPLSKCSLILEQVSRSISSWLPSLEGTSQSRSAARYFVPHLIFRNLLFACLASSLTFASAGTAEAAKLVQSWAGSQNGSAFTAAEAQARAVAEQGVVEIAAQV